MNARHALPILLIGGGAGSGKTDLARSLAKEIPGAGVVHLDLCYHTDPALAPTVPRFDGEGRVVDFSNPEALDTARIEAAVSAVDEASLIVVEGIFAFALSELERRAAWTVYVDAPADIRLTRKLLRKAEEGKDLRTTLRGYDRTRQAHETHVAPARGRAQLVVDGTLPPSTILREVRAFLAVHPFTP
ncbi:AAA family ATPase [Streptomyces sp. NPDC006482]|uniref:uridine kinase family protein n=1 Tax=Streptomyces sp. NPDC006482 TaxID=3154306 RepID=UPI0033AB9436